VLLQARFPKLPEASLHVPHNLSGACFTHTINRLREMRQMDCHQFVISISAHHHVSELRALSLTYIYRKVAQAKGLACMGASHGSTHQFTQTEQSCRRPKQRDPHRCGYLFMNGCVSLQGSSIGRSTGCGLLSMGCSTPWSGSRPGNLIFSC
jgi:hypothetical protein